MNNPLRSIIVDDESSAIQNLDKMLKDYPHFKVVACESDASKAVNLILDFRPDLIFLDINMPGKTGFEVVNELHEEGCKPEIIFVTAFDKYAIEAIRYAAFDYLLKPVQPAELKSALERLLQKNVQNDRDEQIKRLFERNANKGKIKINTTGGFTLFNPADILYIKADWNYAEIYFDGEKKELVTTNIGSMEEILPRNEFFRINRSIIINIAWLTRVSRKKRLAYLVKNEKEYTFKIPLFHIRKLEKCLEQ